ncbi:MAG TPA: efflux RND transporter periplasmic adaptor subunit [Sedimentibacter sp.]|mgnify:CR=1 FL=1|jgi:RND family efflux transporter MFP subunit|nr:efflux RND transporter periplasmic adaptor subunit [Tissierellia bacterium]HOA19646.1 efflux RND transporter periplasmic adaptor subunit [Sedimentibacter sp.]HPB78935.1 efflux RND transporter periplasmic adaptor subunit [Sedimentibacter sp.]HPY56401.1 efflux RND transporter periplasmic adaptor subunit [Sedimentibacter sp.]HQC69692.1 efflux RND transporter periplasmic adaptor subunit [Sedimentibacter sp.]
MYKKIISIAIVLGLVFFGGYLTAKWLIPKDTEASAGPRYSTKAVERGDIKQGVNLSGQLSGNWGGSITAPRPEGITDSNGMSVSVTYTVEEVFVEPNQMIKKGDNLVRLSAVNLGDILTELTDSIQKKQEDIQAKISNLEKILNKDVTDISQVNAYDGIVFRAPIRGRITELSVEEGEKVENFNIATIVDDSMVKISFKVNTYEFESLKEGQKVLLQYRKTTEHGSQLAFDGFYPGTIKKLNKNKVPNGMTYVHTGTIEAENPGLVQPGMTVSIYTENNGIPVTALSYTGEVNSFVNEKKVTYSYLHGGENSNVIATEVYVSTNEFVEEGDLLVRIAGSDVTQLIQNDIDEITNAYKEIENIYRRIDKISELTSKLMVTAPTDGMVAYVNYRVGDQITANEQSDQWSLMLMDVYNTDEMYIYTNASDLDVLYIAQDAPVIVTVDALPGETFDGKVMRLDSYTDYRTGETVYNVQIRVEGREGLRPGMNTNCFVDSGESLDTLLIPIEAVFEENGKQKVEILKEDNQVEVVEIETGLMNDMYVEVISGLEEGQLVVTGSTKDLMPSQSVPESDIILPGTNK